MLNMENTEEVLQILERYTRLKQKEIPKELDEYLCYIAKTGDTVYKWSSLKYLFREKLLSVIKDFHDSTQNIDDLPQYPNVDPFNYEGLKSVLLERLDLFSAAPFTIQRLCDLLTNPRKQYSRIDKYMRALEKTILVVSTIDPGRKTTESENGDSLDSLANGDLSLDVNVDMETEAELPAEPVLCKVDINDSPSKTSSKVLKNSKSDDDILPNPKKPKLDIKDECEEKPEMINSEIERTVESGSKAISDELATENDKVSNQENNGDSKNETDMNVATDEKAEGEIQNGKDETSVEKSDEDIKIENNNKDEENIKSNGEIKIDSESNDDDIYDVSDKVDATINEKQNDVITDKCDESKTENTDKANTMEKSETVEKGNLITTTTDPETTTPKEVITDNNESSDSSNKENVPVKEEEETKVSTSSDATVEKTTVSEEKPVEESITANEKPEELLQPADEVSNVVEKVVEAVAVVNKPLEELDVVIDPKPSEEIAKDEPSAAISSPITQTDISKPSLSSSTTPVETVAEPIDTSPTIVSTTTDQPMDETPPQVVSNGSTVEETTNGVASINPDSDVAMQTADAESTKDDKADTAKMDVDDSSPDEAMDQ